ncbi:MAG: MFS transporter [Alphaproteobacteria bacterium]
MTEHSPASRSPSPSESDAEQPHTTLRAIICVIISVAFFGLAYGYSLPVLSLIMERGGVSSTVIGLNTATSAAAVLLFGPLVPRLLGRFGLRLSIFASILLSVVLIPPIAVTEPLYAWFPLRFALGAAIFSALIAADIWVTQGASAKTRGRLVGLYGASVAGGIAAGPLLVALTGSEGYAPFICAGVLLAMALVPMLFAYGPQPSVAHTQSPRLRSFVVAVPVATLSVLIFGVMDPSILSLLPIYGLRLGMGEQQAVRLVSLVMAGSVLLQPLIGYFADRFSKVGVLIFLGALGCAAAVLLPLCFHVDAVLYPALFVLGGSVSGLYVVSLAILGDRFVGGALAAAVTVFTMLVSAGATIGPVLAGAAMRAYDPEGFPATIAAAMLLVPAVGLITWIVKYSGRRRA